MDFFISDTSVSELREFMIRARPYFPLLFANEKMTDEELIRAFMYYGLESARWYVIKQEKRADEERQFKEG